MRILAVFMGLIVILLAAGCGRMSANSAFTTGVGTTVPMQLVHMNDTGVLPLVPVRIGERTSWWLIDTGSSDNLISTRLAESLQLKEGNTTSYIATIAGAKRGKYYALPDLYIGNLKLEQQNAASTDLSLLSSNDSVAVDGILGVPALESSVVSLDYRNRRASFAREPLGLNPHSVIPLRMVSGVPVISLKAMDGRPGEFILDTGNAGGLVILPGYARHSLGQQHGTPFINIEDLGGKVPTQLVTLPQLMLGNNNLQQVPVLLPVRNHGFSALAGSAGNALFSDQMISIDFPRKQLLLSAYSPVTQLPGSYGFMLAAGNTVEVVLPNSPAAHYGMQAGDRVVSVEGRDTSQASSHTIWRLLHNKPLARIALWRNGVIYNAKPARGYFLPNLQ